MDSLTMRRLRRRGWRWGGGGNERLILDLWGKSQPTSFRNEHPLRQKVRERLRAGLGDDRSRGVEENAAAASWSLIFDLWPRTGALWIHTVVLDLWSLISELWIYSDAGLALVIVPPAPPQGVRIQEVDDDGETSQRWNFFFIHDRFVFKAQNLRVYVPWVWPERE